MKVIQATSLLKGVFLIDFAVMSNHIHLKIESEKSRTPLTKASLIRLAKALYTKNYIEDLKWAFSQAEKIDVQTGDTWHTQNILNRYENRRRCLSGCMKEVQLRIALS